MDTNLLTIIKNLNKVAKFHADYCKDETCNIQLFLIKQAAKELSNKLNNEESLQVLHMNWPV